MRRIYTYTLHVGFVLVFILNGLLVQATERSVIEITPENKEEFVFPLKVNWEFYWKKLLTPDNITDHEPDTLLVPGSWSDVELKGKKIGSTGYATYHITIIGLPNTKLALSAYSIQTSYRIFINENLVAEVGSPGATKETTVPMNRDVQVDIPHDLDSISIIVQVANFHHRKGGFVHAFEIGSAGVIHRKHQLYYYLDFIESSALAIIGLFLLALYVFRRKDLSILYFSLFCISLSFRPVISVNYLLGDVFPGINWSFMIKLEYLSMLLPCLFVILFIKKLFPRQLPTFFVKILSVVLLAEILVTLVFPPSVFSWLTLVMVIVIPIGVLMFVFTIVRALLAREDGARYAAMGLILLLLSQVLKVLSYSGVIAPVHVLITSLDIAFIFMMSMILGSRFSRQFVKVEQLQQQMEQKNKEILDSINYARRLQDAILPSENKWNKEFPDSFIFYRPKDIVAGDFYFLERVGDTVIVAVADCTGHGVPGAIVSVVCANALTRSVREFKLTDPGKILDKTRELVMETLSANESEVKDGMDIALCAIEFRISNSELNDNSKPVTRNSPATLRFAGANNPLWYIENGELKEIKGDKQPIGYTYNPKPFTTHTISNDESQISNLFLFTDGYADQFGGEHGKKFKYSTMKELLVKNSGLPMNKQAEQLQVAFTQWKRDLEQIDDVCLIGIKF